MSFERMAELKSRWLPVYFVLLVVVALLVLHFVLMYFLTGKSGYANLAVVTAFAAYFVYASFDRLRKIKIERRRVIEVVSCTACGFQQEKDHEIGDYVMKSKGQCPKCGGQLVVSAIFSVREQQ